MKVVFDDTMMNNINQFLTSLGDKDRSKLYVSAMKKAAKPMVMTARSAAPFVTGRLFYSIDVIKHPQAESALLFGIKAGGIYVGSWKGRWHDRGWTPKRSKNPKRPSERMVDRHQGEWFIRKGYEDNETNFIPIMNKEINTIIARQIAKYTKR